MNLQTYNYQGSSITFQLDNGDVMANLTEMAKLFGKEPTHFLMNKQTQEFIAALESKLGIPSLRIVRGGVTPGTWAHQKLALKFAAWLSPSFELWVYDRIDELLKMGYTKLDTISRKDLALMLLQSEEENERLQLENRLQAKVIIESKPKVIFADSVVASSDSVLIGELARILKQNGVEIGQNRLFEWLRSNRYLCERGNLYNQPTQASMELGLFEVKKTTINRPDGSAVVQTTTKVTGKGQIYFVNKFLYGKYKSN